MFAVIGKEIVTRLQATAAFTAANGNNKVFPVIIPQLNSCDVSIRIACFADTYGATYNQAKAAVEALDLFVVTYTEDSVSYTAKFRFLDLDDDYFKTPEKFYKNVNFNCLIIKN